LFLLALAVIFLEHKTNFIVQFFSVTLAAKTVSNIMSITSYCNVYSVCFTDLFRFDCISSRTVLWSGRRVHTCTRTTTLPYSQCRSMSQD